MKWLIEKPVPAYPGSHIMRQGYWKLEGTTFEVSNDGREWDITEDGGYLCSTRRIGVAKKICERLAASPKKEKGR